LHLGKESGDPRKFTWRKHGILTPDFLGKKYFLVHRSVDSQPYH